MDLENNFVVGFAFSENAELALIEKRRPAWQKGKINGVGGKRKEGESFDEAMSREFKEETSVSIPFDRWLKFCVLYEDPDIEVHFYTTILNNEEFSKISSVTDERISVFHMKENLPSNVVENLRWLVPMAFTRVKNDLELIGDLW